MENIGTLFANHPHRPPDPSLIATCVAACYECGNLSVACSDAAWPNPASLKLSAASARALTARMYV